MAGNVVLRRRGVRPLLQTVGGQEVHSSPPPSSLKIERTEKEIEVETDAEPLSSEYGSEPGIDVDPWQNIEELESQQDKENELEIKKNQGRSRNREPRYPRNALSERQGRPAPSSIPGSSDLSKSLKRKRQEHPKDLSAQKDGSNEVPSATQDPPPLTQDEEMNLFPGRKPKNIHTYQGSSQRQRPQSSYGSQSASQRLPKGKKTESPKRVITSAFRPPLGTFSKISADTATKPTFNNPPKPGAGPQLELATFKSLSSPMRSSASSSGLSSPPLSSDDGFADEDEASSVPGTAMQPVDDTPRCPMCNGAVDAVKLSSWREKCRKGVPTRQQAMKFCEEHKASDAKVAWTESRYPSIDWDNFDSRLENFHHQLDLILKQRAPSTFRAELEGKAKAGQLTKRLRDVDASAVGRNAGYYGEEGAERMTSHILKRFRQTLQKVASTDKLFMDLGVAGFVQDVLVPELTLMLIREDFACDEARAMEILKESGEIGEIFNQEKTGDAIEEFRRDMQMMTGSERDDELDVELEDDGFVEIDSLEESKPSKESLEVIDLQQLDTIEPAKRRRTGRAMRSKPEPECVEID